jgi:steroid delta-isomerase
MDNKHMVGVVERYMDAFNNKDINIIRDMYAEDAVVEDPVGSDPHVGIKAILDFYQGAIDSGPTLALNGPVRCAGKSAAFPFQVRMGEMTISIIDVFDFNDDGKVVNMRAYWGPDNMSQG